MPRIHPLIAAEEFNPERIEWGVGRRGSVTPDDQRWTQHLGRYGRGQGLLPHFVVQQCTIEPQRIPALEAELTRLEGHGINTPDFFFTAGETPFLFTRALAYSRRGLDPSHRPNTHRLLGVIGDISDYLGNTPVDGNFIPEVGHIANLSWAAPDTTAQARTAHLDLARRFPTLTQREAAQTADNAFTQALDGLSATLDLMDSIQATRSARGQNASQQIDTLRGQIATLR